MKKTNNKKYKQLKVTHNITLIFCSALFIITLFVIFSVSNMKNEGINKESSFTKYPNITYGENLDDEQIDNLKEIISKLKISYLNTAKKITFVNEFEEEISNTAGYNVERNIYIAYTDDLKDLRNTICHELIHDFIPNEEFHYFVYDLANQDVCYKKSVWGILQ